VKNAKEEKMKKNVWMFVALMMILPAMISISCAKKQTGSKSSVSDTTSMGSTGGSTLSDAERARIEAERLREEQERKRLESSSLDRNKFVNDDIYFEFDSSALMPEAQRILNDKADFLRANQIPRVLIEGHCDDRGTSAYNMALGQRRADTAKDYLIKLGISTSRLNTISYGEERPLVQGNSEDAWARNRRAHFVIQ
jgi:peptidoglycan-associated lipoprotein